MGMGQTEGRLHDAVGRLEDSLSGELAAERSASWTTRSIVAVVLTVVGTFVLVNYLHFKNEWTQENVTRSLQTQWEELKPAALAELQTLGRNVAPAYGDEFRKQLPEMAPEVGHALHQQTDRFAEDLRADATEGLKTSMSRTVGYTVEKLFESFPSMQNAAEKEKVTQRFEEVLDESISDAIVHFNGRFASDASAFQESVLDVPRTNVPTRDLVKRFVRLWVQWLDEGIRKL